MNFLVMAARIPEIEREVTAHTGYVSYPPNGGILWGSGNAPICLQGHKPLRIDAPYLVNLEIPRPPDRIAGDAPHRLGVGYRLANRVMKAHLTCSAYSITKVLHTPAVFNCSQARMLCI